MIFLDFHKERVRSKELAAGTLKNYYRAAKLFCEMNDLTLNWKRISKGLPRAKNSPNDRAPTVEEIRKLIQYPDRRIKPICRELGLQVTVAERGPAPLASALGQAAGNVAAMWQRQYGVDLRCNVTVMALEGDTDGRLRRAQLYDGDVLDIDVAVVALGAVRNVEWLLHSC
jgi:hypothetical protein